MTGQDERDRAAVNRRYVATLAGIAVVLLIIGLFTRRWLEPTKTPNTAAPPSQATAMQQLSMEGQLRRTASFLNERVTEMTPLVVFVPAFGSSGVRWTRDTLLTSDSTSIVRVVVASTPDSTLRVATIAPDSVRRDWLLIVARDSADRVLSTTSLAGGRSSVDCGGVSVETYVLGAPLDERFAGGGIFNVSGEMLGMAAWCGGRVRAVPALELRRLLATPDTATALTDTSAASDSLAAASDTTPRRRQ
ncbi:MAG TPA: hypothetical protein VJT85_01655 [Gemmatimonadaceae bacterium]|nr:hypothetical protein [Gemmatimonadaceae bacterium]